MQVPVSSNTSLLTFGKHSSNVELSGGENVARRLSGYQGIAYSSLPLVKGQLIQIQVDKLNPRWTSSVIVGVTETCPDKAALIPTSSLSMKNGTWIVASDSLFENGVKMKDNFCSNLDNIQVGESISLLHDLQGNVHFMFNGNSNLIRTNVTGKLWLMVDLYGETEQVTIYVGEDCRKSSNSNINFLQNGNTLQNSSSFCSEKGLAGGAGDPAQCEYFQACLRFKSALCLPEAYFVTTEFPMCFCSKCMQIRGDETFKEQGDPLEKHTFPKNWVRFPINITLDVNNSSCDQTMMTGLMTNSTSSLSNVLTTWHVAYYGLPIYQVRQVMDCGQLRCPEVYYASPAGSSEGTKDDKAGSTELVFSPVIQYASIDEFACPKKGYVDSKTKQRVTVKAAFELLVQPGSYRIGPPSQALSPSFHALYNGNDTDKFDLNCIEWSTKEQGATHVAALLLCMEGFTTAAVVE